MNNAVVTECRRVVVTANFTDSQIINQFQYTMVRVLVFTRQLNLQQSILILQNLQVLKFRYYIPMEPQRTS